MTERLRGRAGQAQRLMRLEAEPLCRICVKQGRVTAATVPDHIKPLALGGTDDDMNIQCLCDPCHDKKTRDDFGQRQVAGSDVGGWPTDPAHPWNATA